MGCVETNVDPEQLASGSTLFSEEDISRLNRAQVNPAPAPPPLWKITKNIWFLSNNGLYPLKNLKATKPAFDVGPSSVCQPNTLLGANDGSLTVVFGFSLPSSTKKKIVKIGPPLKVGPPMTKLSGSPHSTYYHNVRKPPIKPPWWHILWVLRSKF